MDRSYLIFFHNEGITAHASTLLKAVDLSEVIIDALGYRGYYIILEV